MDNSATISIGSKVVISGIVARPDINSQIGTVRNFDPIRDRYVVALPNERLRIRPQNLFVVPKSVSLDRKRYFHLLDDISGPRSGRDILSSEVESRERWPFYPTGVITNNVTFVCDWFEYSDKNGCARILAHSHSQLLKDDLKRAQDHDITKHVFPTQWLFPVGRGLVDLTDKRRLLKNVFLLTDYDFDNVPWPLSDYTWHCPGCLEECLDGIFSLEGMSWTVNRGILTVCRVFPRLWCGTCYDKVRSIVCSGSNHTYLNDRAEHNSPYDAKGSHLIDLYKKYTGLKKEYLHSMVENHDKNYKKLGIPSKIAKNINGDAQKDKSSARIGKTTKLSCNVCNKTSKFKCTTCESVHYCSKSCQKIDWKENGHKSACGTLKAKLERDAAHVLRQLLPPEEEQDDLYGFNCHKRMRWAQENPLDTKVAFAFAVKGGLHDALRSFFREDIQKMRARYVDDIGISATAMAVNSLFRQRSPGRANPNYRLGEVAKGADCVRCCDYIVSHPNAWTAWLGAIAELARCPFYSDVRQIEPIMGHALGFANESLIFLELVLLHRECAWAILIECGQGASTITTLRATMIEIEGKVKEGNVQSEVTIYTALILIIAMVNVWCNRFTEEGGKISTSIKKMEESDRNNEKGNKKAGIPLMLQGKSLCSLLEIPDVSHLKNIYNQLFRYAEAIIDRGKLILIDGGRADVELSSIKEGTAKGLKSSRERQKKRKGKKNKKDRQN